MLSHFDIIMILSENGLTPPGILLLDAEDFDDMGLTKIGKKLVLKILNGIKGTHNTCCCSISSSPTGYSIEYDGYLYDTQAGLGGWGRGVHIKVYLKACLPLPWIIDMQYTSRLVRQFLSLCIYTWDDRQCPG